MPERKPSSYAVSTDHPELALEQQLRTFRRALKVKEVADLLHCSDQTVYRLMHDQGLPFFRVRDGYRIDRHALAAWIVRRHMDAA